jgi:hypothetical protein
MSSRNELSGLTSIGIPGAQIVVTIVSAGTAKVEIKKADGSDPSPGAPLYTAMRKSAGSGSIYEGRIITVPLSLTFHDLFGVSTINTPARIWVVLIDDNGTFRLGGVCCSAANRIVALDEEKLINTTNLSVSDIGQFLTDTVALTGVPFKIVGYFTFNSGIGGGGFSAAPDVIQMFGPGIGAPGEIVQSNAEFGTNSLSITANIPLDNTIPQSTEGANALSPVNILPFVAHSPANWIEHDIQVSYATTSALQVALALFSDLSADAFASVSKSTPASSSDQIRILTRLQAGATTQFFPRIGVGSATITTNAITAGGTALGSTIYSGYKVTEYMG